MDIAAFAANLERLRRAAGLSKTELASLAGIKNASILTRYEQAKVANPGMEHLAKLAAALSVTVDELGSWPDAVPQQKSDDELDERIKTVLEQYLGNNSYVLPTEILQTPDESADSLKKHEDPPTLMPGYERVEMFDLRVSADVTRYLLHDDVPERSVGDAMLRSSRRWSKKSKVIAFRVQGNCLAPVVDDGWTVFVEIERRGFPVTNLRRAVDSVVFANVGGALHMKILREQDGSYWLTPLNGDEPIKVDADVRIIGIAIQKSFDDDVKAPQE